MKPQFSWFATVAFVEFWSIIFTILIFPTASHRHANRPPPLPRPFRMFCMLSTIIPRPPSAVATAGFAPESGGALFEGRYALIRKVRALGRDQGCGVPAVALTAYARAEDRMKALASGFQMHVAKPVEPGELVMVVASLAGRVHA